MAKKEREYQHTAVQFDQMLYVERMDVLIEATEKNNELLQKLVDAQTPKTEAKSTTSKKATTPTEKEPAEDKKGD